MQDSVTRFGTTGRVVEQVIARPLFTIGNTAVTPATVVAFVVIIAIAWLLSLLMQRATVRGLSLRSKADPATVAIATRLVHYAVLMIGFGIALQTIGINVAALFAAGAFFAIALGFAMQNVAENFVAGVILMTERTIKPGDVLEVEGTVVRVTKLGMRATVVRSRNEEDLVIPNSILVQNTLTNYTLSDSLIRIRAVVGVAYESDVAQVIEVLHRAALTVPDRVPGRDPIVLLTGFEDSSIGFEVSVWVSDPWTSRQQLSRLYQSIWWALKGNKITIPFPQRDIHLHGSAGQAGEQGEGNSR